MIKLKFTATVVDAKKNDWMADSILITFQSPCAAGDGLAQVWLMGTESTILITIEQDGKEMKMEGMWTGISGVRAGKEGLGVINWGVDFSRNQAVKVGRLLEYVGKPLQITIEQGKGEIHETKKVE